VGASSTLTATVTPPEAPDKSVSWTSSDTNVAAVDAEGRVTGVARGTATVTVTTVDGGKTDTCEVTVTFPATGPNTPLTSITDIGNYLSAASTDPVPLPVDIDLSGSGWTDLLSAIDGAGKAAALDLSACTMTGTAFNPGAAATGEDKIVSLILPDTATSIAAGSYADSTFENFTALERVSGANIETVGEYAFQDCDRLKTVNLPKAENIGTYAFADCDRLETVDLPKAENIGEYAFRLTALETVSLPEAVTIGGTAFEDCDRLETVNLPKAVTIGEYAFYGCDALETVRLPADPPTLGGTNVFTDTGAGTTLYIRVPAGRVSAYTTAWGVSANTAANGDTGKYGNNHKQIVITDTP
jgi:hypothetical protein